MRDVEARDGKESVSSDYAVRMSLTLWGASSRAALAVGAGTGRRWARGSTRGLGRAVKRKAGACPASAHASGRFDLVMQTPGILQFVFLKIIDERIF